ncbi:general odorant-binding protein 56d-like [Chironomus tepperi]|uniref:general odorant-binding protein 56d-like n=1 Tax=Chironomus tepperi TaxID=113505 RepID=UPI00391F5541
MKFIIAIFVVISIASLTFADEKHIEEAKNKAEEYIASCKTETGISDENADKIKAGDFSVKDEKAQCFTHCFFKKASFVNDKGEIQPDVMISKLSHKPTEKNEALEALINRCVKEKGESDCETSFKVYECYRGGAVAGSL